MLGLIAGRSFRKFGMPNTPFSLIVTVGLACAMQTLCHRSPELFSAVVLALEQGRRYEQASPAQITSVGRPSQRAVLDVLTKCQHCIEPLRVEEIRRRLEETPDCQPNPLKKLEVRAGIEPAYADLQSDASPLCHRTPGRRGRISCVEAHRVKSHQIIPPPRIPPRLRRGIPV